MLKPTLKLLMVLQHKVKVSQPNMNLKERKVAMIPLDLNYYYEKSLKTSVAG